MTIKFLGFAATNQGTDCIGDDKDIILVTSPSFFPSSFEDATIEVVSILKP